MGSSVLDDALVGCLWGTAVGDAVGLCCEGLSRRRQQKLYPHLASPRFLLHCGMVSDDTEHACMVAQSLVVSGGDERIFVRDLAWRLRFWLLGMPAGIGLATLRAILRLWVGIPPARSGVFSAGNGPSMRSPIIGVAYSGDIARIRLLVSASTRMTHTDPKAQAGALAVALAAAFASRCIQSPSEFLRLCRQELGEPGDELCHLLEQAARSAEAGDATSQFADQLGQHEGVSGYTYHTVPVVLHAWFRHGNHFREAILEVIRCGGDTDTAAAILGGIMGAGVGRSGIPRDWLDALLERPRTVAWMEQLGQRLAQTRDKGGPQPALPLFLPGVLARNLCFAAVVLLHGFRRLLPPY